MPAVGMLVLGAYLGFVSIYALMKVEDWSNPIATLGGVIASVLAVTVFTIFEVAVTPIGDAIYFYPVGLGIGALCAGLRWMGSLSDVTSIANLPRLAIWHIAGCVVAGVLVLVLVFSPTVRSLLPQPTVAVATVPNADEGTAPQLADEGLPASGDRQPDPRAVSPQPGGAPATTP